MRARGHRLLQVPHQNERGEYKVDAALEHGVMEPPAMPVVVPRRTNPSRAVRGTTKTRRRTSRRQWWPSMSTRGVGSEKDAMERVQPLGISE